MHRDRSLITFVVRFSPRGEGDTLNEWRGSVEHVESGRQISFLDIETLQNFLRSFGVTLEDERASGPDERLDA